MSRKAPRHIDVQPRFLNWPPCARSRPVQDGWSRYKVYEIAVFRQQTNVVFPTCVAIFQRLTAPYRRYLLNAKKPQVRFKPFSLTALSTWCSALLIMIQSLPRIEFRQVFQRFLSAALPRSHILPEPLFTLNCALGMNHHYHNLLQDKLSHSIRMTS